MPCIGQIIFFQFPEVYFCVFKRIFASIIKPSCMIGVYMCKKQICNVCRIYTYPFTFIHNSGIIFISRINSYKMLLSMDKKDINIIFTNTAYAKSKLTCSTRVQCPLTSKHFRYNMHRKIIDNIHFIPPSSYH